MVSLFLNSQFLPSNPSEKRKLKSIFAQAWPNEKMIGRERYQRTKKTSPTSKLMLYMRIKTPDLILIPPTPDGFWIFLRGDGTVFPGKVSQNLCLDHRKYGKGWCRFSIVVDTITDPLDFCQVRQRGRDTYLKQFSWRYQIERILWHYLDTASAVSGTQWIISTTPLDHGMGDNLWTSCCPCPCEPEKSMIFYWYWYVWQPKILILLNILLPMH